MSTSSDEDFHWLSLSLLLFLGSNKIYVPSDYSKAATEGSLGTRGGSIDETYEVDK